MVDLILHQGIGVVSDHTCLTSHMTILKHAAKNTYLMPLAQTMHIVPVNTNRKAYTLEIRLKGCNHVYVLVGNYEFCLLECRLTK